jgi:hypothetical protein
MCPGTPHNEGSSQALPNVMFKKKIGVKQYKERKTSSFYLCYRVNFVHLDSYVTT